MLEFMKYHHTSHTLVFPKKSKPTGTMKEETESEQPLKKNNDVNNNSYEKKKKNIHKTI